MFKGWLSKYLGEMVRSLILVILTILITEKLTNKSPNVVVKQYYNSFDSTSAVPNKIGELVLDYKEEKPTDKLPYYLVTVLNEGNGAEENLSFQIRSTLASLALFYKEPNLKVFGLKQITFEKGEFFAELEKFPIGAVAEVAFVPPDNAKSLCDVNITVAGKTEIGRVEKIRGVECE